MNDWFAALGLKPIALVGGLLGALVSLKFIPGDTLWQRATNVAGGTLSAAFGAPFVVAAFSFSDKLIPGFAFIIGLYGMTAAASIVVQIPKAVQAVRERYAGKDGQ